MEMHSGVEARTRGRTEWGRRSALAVLGAALALAMPASASAQITGVFARETVSGNAIPCTAQSDGVRVCEGMDGGGGASDLRLKSFDGTPLGLYVVLPPKPASGADGNYPLIVQSHGWDSPTAGPSDTQYFGPTGDQWAKDGVAVLELDARGFGDSCGTAASRLADPSGCLNGYIHLDDERYEVRDIQYAIGLLVDEGIVNPSEIGITGESYGAGATLELATLKNRIMNMNGTFSPWTSPNGTPLSIRVAVAAAPWSDLVNSLAPNGHTLDYQIASPTTDLDPVGVEKESFVNGLFAIGNEQGYYSAPLTNSDSDIAEWAAALDAGEPYDGESLIESVVQQIAQFHSPYYVLDGAFGAVEEAPPPLMLLNGFTDDLFPVDEALRYYNFERSRYPNDPIALLDFDGGHMRGSNKPADVAYAKARVAAFISYYLTGEGPKPLLGATAMTQTCPSSAPSGGPYWASTWAGLHPGEVDYSSAASQTILSTAGNPAVSATFDPIVSDGLSNTGTSMACLTAPATPEGPGVATYRLPAATGSGYTLLGAPTVVADLNVTGEYPYIAERLLDVDPASNTETLVARGDYRLDPDSPDGLQVFQLHPGAWHFAAGHIPELELLGRDAPYLRPSNGAFSITVSDLQLRLPVHEQPGAAPAVVAPRPHVAPVLGCASRPSSRIEGRAASARSLKLAGVAAPGACAHASAASVPGQRLAHVYVLVYQVRSGHGETCRFLTRGLTLTGWRSCSRPVALLARGTGHWTLTLRGALPRGHFRVRSDAVDALGEAQRRSAASFTAVRVG
jgi:X-Pro dipeptidyl-peptidase (S15 family)